MSTEKIECGEADVQAVGAGQGAAATVPAGVGETEVTAATEESFMQQMGEMRRGDLKMKGKTWWEAMNEEQSAYTKEILDLALEVVRAWREGMVSGWDLRPSHCQHFVTRVVDLVAKSPWRTRVDAVFRQAQDPDARGLGACLDRYRADSQDRVLSTSIHRRFLPDLPKEEEALRVFQATVTMEEDVQGMADLLEADRLGIHMANVMYTRMWPRSDVLPMQEGLPTAAGEKLRVRVPLRRMLALFSLPRDFGGPCPDGAEDFRILVGWEVSRNDWTAPYLTRGLERAAGLVALDPRYVVRLKQEHVSWFIQECCPPNTRQFLLGICRDLLAREEKAFTDAHAYAAWVERGDAGKACAAALMARADFEFYDENPQPAPGAGAAEDDDGEWG